jgi:hypothetical protein
MKSKSKAHQFGKGIFVPELIDIICTNNSDRKSRSQTSTGASKSNQSNVL